MPKALSPREAKKRTRASSPSGSTSRPLPPLAMMATGGYGARPRCDCHGLSGSRCYYEQDVDAVGSGSVTAAGVRTKTAKRKERASCPQRRGATSSWHGIQRHVSRRVHSLVASSHLRRPPPLPTRNPASQSSPR